MPKNFPSIGGGGGGGAMYIQNQSWTKTIIVNHRHTFRGLFMIPKMDIMYHNIMLILGIGVYISKRSHSCFNNVVINKLVHTFQMSSQGSEAPH